MATVMVPETAGPSATLRAELKEWERAFADANGGRKAGRSDIKKDPEIAAKYKEYSRLKSLETKPAKTNDDTPHKKRKHTSPHGPDPATAITPRKKTGKGAGGGGAFETPSKNNSATRPAAQHPAEVDPYDSPSVLRRLFSPSTHLSPLKAAIGPTPQRDGKALGLFDLLSESGGSTATPSASRIAGLKDASVRTPSRRRGRRASNNTNGNALGTIAEEGEEENDIAGGEEEESPRLERTPASSGKKWMLSTLFATPTTWRYAAMMEDGSNKKGAAAVEGAPGGNAATAEPNESETPSFLRRSTSGRFDGSTITGGLSPMAARTRPQFVGKGLSALVQGLRDMEEEQMQDDLDVLREIEAEQAAMNAQVADSQAAEGGGGPVWKKKGQKRTTRRVRMKPVVAPAKQPAPELLPGSDDGDEQEDQGPGIVTSVPETQQLLAPGPVPLEQSHTADSDLDSLHTMSEPDFDSDPDYDEGPQLRKSFSEKMKEAIAAGKPPATTEQSAPSPPVQAQEPEPKKPRARKVNPEAHANYRSLKIRNKNSKGRGAGRFGRRR
ncbi:protein sld2 [Aspergillus homomorphus CBS 101889]|uniref:DNA replication regulator SLD2 n=1 Tax=Aspergillus homomorphus (strain CBS 101889) TaxID=1450537 RepID=A0A395HY32_ASPHC|nr:hypothetical protein BO97DRAFT_390759 [Aspergillus homomorphus CBS 101889]RAL12345.1 hypothetical protein BO97DRAFT_390759 [Aspergillus homomorphus CBS 101889]